MTNERSRGTDFRLFVSLLIGGIVIFVVALGIGRWLDAKPGSLADWIAAVSTFAALIAASYAAVQTSRTFKLEQERDRQRDQDMRQRQAELVAVWAGRVEHIGPRVTDTFTSRGHHRSVEPGVVRPTSIPVTIRNASQMPIYNLTVDVYVGRPSEEAPVLGGRFTVEDPRHGLAVLGTLEDVEVMTPELTETIIPVLEARPGSTKEPSPICIGWSFRDNAGVLWRRLPDGRLEEHDPRG